MAKYILYEETDEGKSVIGEYKRKCDLEEDVKDVFCSMLGLYYSDLFNFDDDEWNLYKQIEGDVKYLLKTKGVVFSDNRYSYEKK